MSKKELENIEDDLQHCVDRLFDKISTLVAKETRNFKDDAVRSVCVDYPHVDAAKIKAVYKTVIEKSLGDLSFYEDIWFKNLRDT